MLYSSLYSMNSHDTHSDSHHQEIAPIMDSHSGATHDTHKLSPFVNALINVFEEARPSYHEGSKYQVSRTVSLLAALYEKARNAVEFRAEHLIRRASIERIL